MRELARKHTTDALKTLVDIMKHKLLPASARVAAANAILDRGYGKPLQHGTLTIDDRRDIDEFTDAELLDGLEILRSRKTGNGSKATRGKKASNSVH